MGCLVVSLAGLRSRWAAIGAACAVSLGAGGFGLVSASVSSGDRAVYVPVTPIRVLDTRQSSKVVNETVRLLIEGIITTADGVSQEIVPTDASAVAINVTATSTGKNGDHGYVTAFSCTSDTDVAPNTSSVNFENGIDVANALNVTTSANGSICLYVFGAADLLVDVAGYYADHNHDDRYYTKAEIDAVLESKANTSDVDSALQGFNTQLNKKVDKCGYGGTCIIGGQGPGGGIVFYDAGSQQSWGRYLEAACTGWTNNCDGTTADPLVRWGCKGSAITGADGTAIGTGEQNNLEIVEGCSTLDIAAKRAADLVLGGQDDWFLPSRNELLQMFTNKAAIGGFSAFSYWSSSESDSNSAWNKAFTNGEQNVDDKFVVFHMRPVRAF